MKLKNKKTGEIVEVDFIYPETAEFFYPNFKLVDFNELFEDYEEPKDGWCIDYYDAVKVSPKYDALIKEAKLIGNYFETKEEAEKAVEKLKAWKRLKDKGFKFRGWIREHKKGSADITIASFIDEDYDITNDLNLLFGGEE